MQPAARRSLPSRELLLAALRGESTDRPAWVPFVGVHGGQLTGLSSAEYLRSADAMVAGLTEAQRRYRPDGLPVAFDLQIEAEILGCELSWADKTPPSVATHPLSVMEGPGMQLAELPEFSVHAGRMPIVLDATRKARAALGDEVALYGLITGPFTLAMHLMGSDLFMAMFDDEDKVDQVLAFCADIGVVCADAYIQAGADVVAVVDPMTSQISPEHFERFVSKPVNRVFDAVHRSGGLASLFVCGDAGKNLPVMFKTTCDNVSIDENIPLDHAVELGRMHSKSVGGNLKLTAALLLGDEAQCRADALRCIDAGAEPGTEGGAYRGFVLAPGCDLPYDTPAKNLEAVAELVFDTYQRDIARRVSVETPDDRYDDIDLPDYPSEGKVIVDVVTLDSAGCAPCFYMVRAAENAAKRVPGTVVREHKITGRDGFAYMTKLNVSAVPSICIDGRVAYASMTPDVDTLSTDIQAALERKAPVA